MLTALEKTEKAYNALKNYKGTNPFILKLKKDVLGYQLKTLNDFESEYVIMNHDKEPRKLDRIVKVADFWGEKKKEEWGLDFIPEKVKITWLLGETTTTYHFFCMYRQSQEKAVECWASKKSILTSFDEEDWRSIDIDFKPYNEKSGRTLYPHQEEAIKFLTSRKKAILADVMGFGKTTSAIVAALEDKYEHVLIICPASVKISWKNELKAYIPEEEITIVEGSNWDDNKFTIINYDILKNFYKVPTEVCKRSELNVDDNGKIVKVVKEKQRVSRKSEVISKAMENSQLFQSKFDLIIIDEAHRLSNSSSGIFKIVSDLVKRSNPRGVYELSGTLITNKPINLYNTLKIIDHPITKDWKAYVERYCDGKSFYNKRERAAHTAIFCRSKGKGSWFSLTAEEKKELNEMLNKRCRKIWITNGASHLDELQEVIKPYYLRRDKQDLDLVKKNIHTIEYDLTPDERIEYDKVWDEYVAEKEEREKTEKHKTITEGIVFRQWLAKTMTSRTIDLVSKYVNKGEKVVVFCTFDEELNAIKEAFKDICVVHNGKLTSKKKNESVEKFRNDDNIKVFIGNIMSAGVGLTLVESRVVIFNSITFVPGDMLQAEDRVHRLNQTKDCNICYQIFKDTYMEHMFSIVHEKNEIIDKIIIREKEK